MSGDTFGAIPIERGCGVREQDGLYFECGFGPGGSPVEAFIINPPEPCPPDFELAALGVTLIEAHGAWHIVDWIGSEHYPNVWDFLEEAANYGVSRRLNPLLDFSKLTPESRLLCVHARGHVANFREYGQWTCPKGRPDHHRQNIAPEWPYCCAGIWAEDIEGGASFRETRQEYYEDARIEVDGVDGTRVDSHDPRAVVRSMPSFWYYGRKRPDRIKPEYKPAFVASFPASRLVVIGGGDFTEERLAQAGKSKLPVVEVAE